MSRKNVGIIGHFGGNENILDGQTIKTKILYNELQSSTNWKIIKVDTYYKSKNPIKLLFDTLVCLISAQDIIVLLSKNGMRYYFPLLYFCTKVFHARVFHDVIGGNLNIYIKKYPRYVKYLNSFEKNWIETDGLKEKLEKEGINNCEVIPNFKRLKVIELKNANFNEPYKFCVFSRVMKEKGIETAIEAIESINREAKREVCSLDIYGRIDSGYKERFDNVMLGVTKSISYKGTVSYEQSVEVIMGYYALLFPTFWDGEGFPGTIVDAFSAGLPVIATDWNCNSEIIENEKNGILYPNNEIKNLKDAIKWLINNNTKIQEMKKNCLDSAKKYNPDKYIQQIINAINDVS